MENNEYFNKQQNFTLLFEVSQNCAKYFRGSSMLQLMFKNNVAAKQITFDNSIKPLLTLLHCIE